MKSRKKFYEKELQKIRALKGIEYQPLNSLPPNATVKPISEDGKMADVLTDKGEIVTCRIIQ